MSKKILCRTCRQNLTHGPRAGWLGLDCPSCGQGLNSASHVKSLLRRLEKAAYGDRKVRVDR